MAEALDAEWFLVANKDKLSIKIRGQVTLGEDSRGLLMLESRKDSERWITLTIDNSGSLVVSNVGRNWSVESPGAWQSSKPGAVCIPGTLLSLANNEVYISHDLLRGKVEQHLVVKPYLEPEPIKVEVPRVDVVVPEAAVDQVEQEETDTPQVEAYLSTAMPPARAGSSNREPDDVPTLTIPVLSEPVPVVATEQSPSTPEKQSRSVVAVGVLLGVFAVGGYSYWQSLQPEDESFGSRAPSAPTVEAERAPIVQTEVLPEVIPEIISEVETAAVATEPTAESVERIEVASTETATGAKDLPAGLAEEETLPEAESPALAAAGPNWETVGPRDWSQEIEEAQDLIRAGFINYPERNAVQILGDILIAEPDHTDAWLLLNEAARLHLLEARRAQRDGFTQAAIEMVLEAERFHPNYSELPQAKAALGIPSNDLILN